METGRQDTYERMAARITATQPAPDPPPGFEVMDLGDPFEAFIGPYYVQHAKDGTGERLAMAFRVDARHLNASDIVHGGCLMTFADAVFGGIAWNATQRRPCVTLSMQASFLKAVRPGDLVVCEGRVTRKTRAIVFVGGEFKVDGELVLTATSLWKILGAP